MPDTLDGMAVFVVVAEAKGFRAIGERLGVSGSAVSQAMRRLEERLCIPLARHAATQRVERRGEALARVWRWLTIVRASTWLAVSS